MAALRADQRALRQTLLAGAAVLALLLLFAVSAGALLAAALDADERAALSALLQGRWVLLVLPALVLAAAAVALAQPLLQRWVGAPARLLDAAQLLLRTDTRVPLPPLQQAAAPVRGLGEVVHALADQRDALRSDMAASVAEASRGVAQERNRLAALMSELTQSVVVCNRDGRILLYNQRARLQFRALSPTPQLGDGSELIGLGRSIYAAFDRRLVAHALDQVQQRLARGVAQSQAQFVTTTRSGQLLRVQLAPVRSVAGSDDDEAGALRLDGFVLMLENITRSQAAEAAQEQLLHGLTEGSRASLANLVAAAEMLEDEGLPPALRERFTGVIREEAQAMAGRLDSLAAQNAEGLATRWPLEDMLAADFAQAAGQRLAALAPLRVGMPEVDARLWLRLDSFALLQALEHLARRLQEALDVRSLHLRLQPAGAQRAHLDLVWAGQAVSTETVMAWELDPMDTGDSQRSALTVRDVVQRHGGEFWFERDRARQQAFLRFLLPQAAAADVAAAAPPAPADSRPEFYDFDLFAQTERSHALDERPLADLAFTVFDTETTGLNPTGGDRILQLGAVRLLNGRLLRHECFDQLVDPGRDIPPAGIPIHGITPDMVAGRPPITQVLPAFHAFAADTVLVAHNAAFDMRFLQLQEAATGLRFDQPVLDTLLLSALLHPEQASHRLEDIAGRYGVTVVGRHTALGDALVTAEVFVRMLPLLAAAGIRTVGEARAAAQKTWYARLAY